MKRFRMEEDCHGFTVIERRKGWIIDGSLFYEDGNFRIKKEDFEQRDIDTISKFIVFDLKEKKSKIEKRIDEIKEKLENDNFIIGNANKIIKAIDELIDLKIKIAKEKENE